MTNETKIISLFDQDDYVEVKAQAGGETMEFYVGLVEGEYKTEMGCTISTDSQDTVRDNDFPDFDFDEIVGAAESEWKSNHADLYEYKVVDFGITIGSERIVLRVDKQDGETEILTERLENFNANRKYKETGKCFDSVDEAIEFVDSFRTDRYEDAEGLMKLFGELAMYAYEQGID